ncbi:MAG TPA: S9 family peptidase, partial [Flavipsychrobacter sp.]
MKRVAIFLPAILLSMSSSAQKQLKLTHATVSLPAGTNTMPYPETKKGDVVTEFFGTKVADPYRWLEDDTDPATRQWINEQNELVQAYMTQIPFRNNIQKRLAALWNYEKYSAPFNEGEYTYFYKNDGLQNQSVLYRQKGTGTPEVFLDPNKFSVDGTTSLAGIEFTKDGSLCAYQISEGGSDWRKVIILDVKTKAQVGDTLMDVKFS